MTTQINLIGGRIETTEEWQDRETIYTRCFSFGEDGVAVTLTNRPVDMMSVDTGSSESRLFAHDEYVHAMAWIGN